MSSVDRSWMYARQTNGLLNRQFIEGVEQFIAYACSQPASMDGNKIRCPCVRCHNRRFREPNDVHLHLLKKGFVDDYYVWSRHGEPYVTTRNELVEESHMWAYAAESANTEIPNPYHTMVMDAARPSFDPSNVEESPNPDAQRLYDMLHASEQELWPGCETMSQLSAMARLLSIKSEHHLSENCYDAITELFKEALPVDNKLPDNFYSTKKFVEGLGLPVEKIHCCLNGCMIYWGVDSELNICKFCQYPRYKTRRRGDSRQREVVPNQKMYYFPLAPRLQRLYASSATAEHMRWHDQHYQEDGVMRHPSDSEAWKHFDRVHPLFASETRNVRLGLCTDGFQPFGQSGQQYSSWPVIVTPYNLPLWMCMKEEFMFLTVIVPGPKNPKHKIDVFLQPLIHELCMLWDYGVVTWDVCMKQNFQLRAALMWTISDFPAYSMLSGWSTAGKMACPYCMEDSGEFTLHRGGKTSWFDNHRKFLPYDHPYRRNKNWFRKNTVVTEMAPLVLSSEDIFHRIMAFGMEKVTEEGGETRNQYMYRISGCGWKKRSIFWDLPYWRMNLIRHNLDVMHIEKNVFENVFNTVMNIEGKTKDNAKARDDMKVICRRKELEMNSATGKYPKACYSLDKAGKQAVCEWVRALKFPDGYVSNMGRCVDMKKYKMFGMKSHDCHVFMQRLIPIAFRELLPSNVWHALTELSLFFKELTCSTLKVDEMSRLEMQIPIILCKLERIFPPAFFDSMEHLPIHLPYEAKIAGPVQYRWMYPFERFLRHLKKNVKNKAKVEGSICNAYLVEESTSFCSYYFEPHVHTRHRKVPRNDDGGEGLTMEGNLTIFTHPGRPYGKSKVRPLTERELLAAQTYILLNCHEVEQYIGIFCENVRSTGVVSEALVDAALENEFAFWFRRYANDPLNDISNQFIKDLSQWPLRNAKSMPVYFVNGFKFHTRNHGSQKATVNSGVCIKGTNYSESSSDYYGMLDEILILEYPRLPIKRTVLFKCEWFDPTPNVGTKVHPQCNLVEVNQRRRFNKYEPFILAMQAQQVYYAPYPSLRRDKGDWLAVCRVKARPIVDMPESTETSNTNTSEAFQEEESEVQPFVVSADVLPGPLNDPSAPLIELDNVDDEEDNEEEDELNSGSGEEVSDEVESEFEDYVSDDN